MLFRSFFQQFAKMDIGKVALGVVGGGQLGRMMAWPAHRLSVKLVCLDAAGSNAPCAQVGAMLYLIFRIFCITTLS